MILIFETKLKVKEITGLFIFIQVKSKDIASFHAIVYIYLLENVENRFMHVNKVTKKDIGNILNF